MPSSWAEMQNLFSSSSWVCASILEPLVTMDQLFAAVTHTLVLREKSFSNLTQLLCLERNLSCLHARYIYSPKLRTSVELCCLCTRKETHDQLIHRCCWALNAFGWVHCIDGHKNTVPAIGIVGIKFAFLPPLNSRDTTEHHNTDVKPTRSTADIERDLKADNNFFNENWCKVDISMILPTEVSQRHIEKDMGRG